MSLKSFLKLVELPTKVASMIPFLLGTMYALYHFNTFRLTNFVLMLVSLLSIDMATTAINNYMDYKKANKKEGYGYEIHNAMTRFNLKESIVIVTIISLLMIATTFGILLYINTNFDFVVLLLGALSFLIGITYSFGPVPISRTPFGEIFSGGFMGLIIPFISVYIHVYDQSIIDIIYANSQLSLSINIEEVLKIMLISIPAAVGIANIMLANNICDIEDDIENKRYTLPIYIGKKNALLVFKLLYYIGYLSVLIAVIFEVLPLVSSLVFITLIIIHRNIKTFYTLQSKKDTFILAVQNFLLQNVVLVLTIAIGIMLLKVF